MVEIIYGASLGLYLMALSIKFETARRISPASAATAGSRAGLFDEADSVCVWRTHCSSSYTIADDGIRARRLFGEFLFVDSSRLKNTIEKSRAFSKAAAIH
jgi:hypothetical protein